MMPKRFRQLMIVAPAVVILLGVALVVLPTSAQASESPWLGQRFAPEHRTPLVPGETHFRRKLCTITYRIHSQEGGFSVAAALRFNPKFVPRRPRAISLEILLLDGAGTCIGQIDREVAVETEPVPFAFTVSNASVKAVRTYYILHYPDKP